VRQTNATPYHTYSYLTRNVLIYFLIASAGLLCHVVVSLSNKRKMEKVKYNDDNTYDTIQIIPIHINDDIKPHDKLDILILKSLEQRQEDIIDNDILVIAHKIISKAEGRIVNLECVKPSAKSLAIAKENDKDPRIIELILSESRGIVRLSKGLIIVETQHGFICANAGVDQSNVEDSFNHAILLPIDPDTSAKKIRQSLRRKTGKDVAVIITDTFGRPFREGQTNVAIGIDGIQPIKSYIGNTDMYGKKLRVTEIAVVDEIASAAELAMGKLERVPAVIVRGYKYQMPQKKSSISELIRTKEKDIFR
jgi:coenzyme F420-0:L-glutamate ligase/coenzyme F420-1:gamma-L-glutamate ligase